MKLTPAILTLAFGGLLFSACGGDALRDKLINEALNEARKAEQQGAYDQQEAEEAAPAPRGPVGGTELSKDELTALLPQTVMGAPKSGEMVYMKMGDIQTAAQTYKQGEVAYTLTIQDIYGSEEYMGMDYSPYEFNVGGTTSKSFKLSASQHGSTMIGSGPNPVSTGMLMISGRFKVMATAERKALSESEMIEMMKTINLSKLESLAK